MEESEDRARRAGTQFGLSFYIWGNHLYVQDGGKRGRDEIGWESTGSRSHRPATDEEQELWDRFVR